MAQSLLQTLKEKSNIINGKFQTFQTELKQLTHEMMSSEITNTNKPTYTEQINKLCDDYSSSINRLEIEYLIKCEKYFQNSNTNNSNTNTQKQNSFKCEECDISYTAQSSLARHNRKNHCNQQSQSDSDSSYTEQKHKCTKCDKICSSIYCLRTHIRREHSPKHQCNICFKTFKNAKAVSGHKHTHRNINKRPFKCKQCSSDFGQHRYLVQHIINIHKANPWECDQCDKTFRFKRKFNQHKKLAHFNINNSNSKMASDQSDSDAENTDGSCDNTDQDNNLLKCHLCTRTFSKEWGLHMHCALAHKKENNCKFICHYKDCNGAFKLRKLLNEHIAEYHDYDIDAIRFGCNECEERFDNKMELNRHRNSVHLKINPNPFKCDICQKLYASENVLYQHKLTHNEERIFKCNNKELNESSDSEKISIGNEEDVLMKESSVNKRTKSLFNGRL